MGIYRRPPRSDELMHWGKGMTAQNHKYIAKIGNRYFYTPDELKAFKDGVSGKAKGGFDQARQAAINKVGGARDRVTKALGIGGKKRMQDTARRANEAKNDVSKYTDRERQTFEKAYASNVRSAAYDRGEKSKIKDDPSFRSMHAEQYGHSSGRPGSTKSHTIYQPVQRSQHRAIEVHNAAKKNSEEHNKALRAKQDAQSRAAKAQREANQAKTDYENSVAGKAEKAVKNTKKKVNNAVKNAKVDTSKYDVVIDESTPKKMLKRKVDEYVNNPRVSTEGVKNMDEYNKKVEEEKKKRRQQVEKGKAMLNKIRRR